MKKLSLVTCIALAFSIILMGCSDAEIASYASKNNIPMTPELVNSIKQASQQQNPNANGKANGKNNPSNPNPNGNANGFNNPNNPHNPNNITNEPTNPAVNAPMDANSSVPQGGNVTVIQGPQGPAGPQGEKGEHGEDGEDGKDGRGIESLKINDEGHLIAYYTDGTTEDCGMVKGEKGDSGEKPEKDFEKVGYVLPNNFTEEGHFQSINLISSCDYTLQDTCVKLCDVNPNYPLRKYHYTCSGKLIISNYNCTGGFGILEFLLRADDVMYINLKSINANGEYEFNSDFYQSTPIVEVTDLQITDV